MSKKNIFKDVPVQNVPRNYFDLSHEVKLTCKFGYLIPCLLMETLPGDHITDQSVCMIRMAPMVAPVMHKVTVKFDYFFVPARLTTDHWEDFITGGQDGEAEPVLPYVTVAGMGGISIFNGPRSVWDYFGLPPVGDGFDSQEPISVLPFRAYTKIWNDYFRDPNLDDEIDLDLELAGNVSAQSTEGLLNVMSIKLRGWDKDYFTSALPFAQRGPSVLMPFEAQVTYLDNTIAYKAGTVDEYTEAGNLKAGGPGASPAGTVIDSDLAGPFGVRLENIDEITSSGVTINDFRRTLAIQRWMENNARGGARYNEQIYTHFRTRVPDYRLQLAEYLGGGRQPMVISEVLSTAEGESVPVGDMAGHGLSVGKSNRFSYHCQEHGFIIGIMSVVPQPSYSQGLHKMWTRRSKFDYAWPELAHLGEQEILSKEIFNSWEHADAAENNEVFGYIPRYAEYKFQLDRIAGDFRTTLAFWHLSRIFTERPSLNAVFMRMDDAPDGEESFRRIFAVQDGTDYLWCQIFHKIGARRPLPYFGVPTLIG